MNVDLGLLILRLVVGGIVLGHGLQKLGYLGGSGFAGTTGMMEHLGFQPTEPWAALVIAAETAGAVLIIVGLGGPIGPGIVIADLVVAMIAVHAPKGWWNMAGGVEFNVVLIGAALTLAFTGFGAWSLDAALNLNYPDWLLPVWAAAMALGVVLAFAVRVRDEEEAEAR